MATSSITLVVSLNLTIRNATLNDARQISMLYKHVWDDYRGKFPDELVVARQPSPIQMEDWLRQETYFVALDGSRIIGVVGCSLEHGTCHLKHMVVSKSYRSQGIGTALTKHVIQYARKNNSVKIWLDTVPILEKAIVLYTKLGFVKCGNLRKHFWGMDAELYELLL